jgi:uncharacterized protein YbaR (Trm112 family)
MSLAARFQQTSESYAIKLVTPFKNQPYPIKKADRCDTRFGPAVLRTIQESENSLRKVFLPGRYSAVMTDDDLTDINSGCIKLSLIYRGVCPQTKGHLLTVTGEEDVDVTK